MKNDFLARKNRIPECNGSFLECNGSFLECIDDITECNDDIMDLIELMDWGKRYLLDFVRGLPKSKKKKHYDTILVDRRLVENLS